MKKLEKNQKEKSKFIGTFFYPPAGRSPPENGRKGRRPIKNGAEKKGCAAFFKTLLMMIIHGTAKVNNL
ncbi:MAG TPA: hypothetical protein DEB16_05165 [Ruminococcaceae bacterium]|nr:hypothetical protein [Oscillospiraceae bacterium]HBQ46265.1 hypothetical protein [Oscillospiraceae bacterium]HBT91217.1 hypothetical protein [Oscillospiraceae bacterium]HCB92111.1 hypothetical protein [Oscillospiraceae bacterium]